MQASAARAGGLHRALGSLDANRYDGIDVAGGASDILIQGIVIHNSYDIAIQAFPEPCALLLLELLALGLRVCFRKCRTGTFLLCPDKSAR